MTPQKSYLSIRTYSSALEFRHHSSAKAKSLGEELENREGECEKVAIS